MSTSTNDGKRSGGDHQNDKTSGNSRKPRNRQRKGGGGANRGSDNSGGKDVNVALEQQNPKSRKPNTNGNGKSTEKGTKNHSNNRNGRGKGRRGGQAEESKKNDSHKGSRGDFGNGDNRSRNDKPSQYPPHWTLEKVMKLYNSADDSRAVAESKEGAFARAVVAQVNDKDNHEQGDSWMDENGSPPSSPPVVIRGTLRVLPGQNAASFVRCDRGRFRQDVIIPSLLERNRAMDGDTVFVALDEDEEDDSQEKDDDADDDEGAGDSILHKNNAQDEKDMDQVVSKLESQDLDDKNNDALLDTWQDDDIQMDLWNPVVSVPRKKRLQDRNEEEKETRKEKQRKGRVVYIVPPRDLENEIKDSNHAKAVSAPRGRRIVGTIKLLGRGTILLTPNNKSLPQFKCPSDTLKMVEEAEAEEDAEKEQEEADPSHLIYQAEYTFGSWKENHKWPPCQKVQVLGESCVLEDEIQALLVEFKVDHPDFSSEVLKDVNSAVESGLFHSEQTEEGESGMNWKPTPDMYKGRRDYRSERIFTIDPTTAKDLDDALHIKLLPDGKTVEVGVHIADVSFFVRPETAVDNEAKNRATTTYLVDRTVPMLPRPLCEIACSLNENVERLAFSCVWRMNVDGSMRTRKGAEAVWYGRTVIRSCARLDYSTAQNIIDGKVDERDPSRVSDDVWPRSRRPTGGHTMAQVIEDVRLMHRVAMARRRLRFGNGALALHGVKLTFTLDSDGQTPLLAAPYPIRDSNRLVEEFMLLANYLVAQRLITHAERLALLRFHPEPLMEGLDSVAEVAKAATGMELDIATSQTLHESLVRLEAECRDTVALRSITHMLMTPMQAAEYFCAGMVPREEWRHFALNIPYYTHFTSPIRRYADVMVHRLLQATLDGPEAVENLPWDEKMIDKTCTKCNDMRMAAKNAQERCDRVYLSLYVKQHPLECQLGIVLSVGKSTFKVFVEALGVSTMLFLEEHKHMLTFAEEQENEQRRILLQRRPEHKMKTGLHWDTLEIEIFTKLTVTVICSKMPPIDVKVMLEGPWVH